MELSLEHQIALLPPDQQSAVLSGMDPDKLLYDWRFMGRPSQFLPTLPGESNLDWNIALVLAGRGFGKTLLGAQWIRELDTHWGHLKRDTNKMRFALLGRTAADVRDVMLEGPSGILRIYPPSVQNRVHWIPSRRRLELPNGSVGICFSAEEPDQLRGPAFHTSYKQVRSGDGELTAWENLRIATRLGSNPQVLATTTPKRVPLVRQLLKEADDPASRFLLRRGKTIDNVKLSQGYRDTLFSLYGGTKLGAQELEGEVLDDVTGAMVAESTIEAHRVTQLPFGIPWIRVIGVDPSVAEKPHDECGMVVVYASRTWPIVGRHAFVVDDVSMQASPAVWADRLVQVANEHQAVVVVEINQGHNLVTQLLKQAAVKNGLPLPPIRPVWSAKSKSVRSEIIGAAYERGRIHHLNVLADLEDQESSWVAGEAGYSPDRLDALVHACAATLFPEALVHGSPGSGTLRTPGNATIPVRHQVTQGRRAG
jgi:phage terminase large subunit-like protein